MTELTRLGNALEAAAAADLARTRTRRRRRTFVALVAALAIAIPGVAVGAKLLTDEHTVAQSMPAGAAELTSASPDDLAPFILNQAQRGDVNHHALLGWLFLKAQRGAGNR